MSDAPMGEGWWKASDGKWYPPQQQPATQPPPQAPPTRPSEPAAAPSAPIPLEQGVPAPTEPASGKGGKGKIVVAVVVVLALVAGGFAAITLLGDDEASAQVTLEALGDAGVDPYTSSVAPPPSEALTEFAASGFDLVETGGEGGPGGYGLVDGTVPGVYGGSLDEDACDVEALREFLAAEDDKAQAWADVLKISPADISAYIDSLTPVNLGNDTRVLNHGYADGVAVPRESVLQRGTAVLVDRHGVPRVNCYCGNPLAEPTVEEDEKLTGDAWPGLVKEAVVVVEEGSSEIDEFELVDVATGELFKRASGKVADPGDADVDIGDATEDLVDDGPIEFDTEYEDALEGDRTEARYILDAPDGAIMTLTIANDEASASPVFVSVTSAGDTFSQFRVQAGADEEAVIVLDHEGGGSVELAFTEGPAAYRFEVALEVQFDAGQEGDAGDDFASAFELTAGEEVAALLRDQDQTDHFVLETEPGAEFTFTAAVSRESERAALIEIEFEGEFVMTERVQPGSDIEFSVLLSDEDEGILDIRVTEGPSEYSFTPTFVLGEEGGEPGDAPGALTDARPIDPAEPLSGQVGTRDEGDYYIFDAPTGSMTVIAASEATGENAYLLMIEDATGFPVVSVRVQPGTEITEAFEVEVGTQIRVAVSEGRAAYTLTFG